MIRAAQLSGSRWCTARPRGRAPSSSATHPQARGVQIDHTPASPPQPRSIHSHLPAACTRPVAESRGRTYCPGQGPSAAKAVVGRVAADVGIGSQGGWRRGPDEAQPASPAAPALPSWISMRATDAPGQRCDPCPETRRGVGWRAASTAWGQANASGSRLAAWRKRTTFSPWRMVRPGAPSSSKATSPVAYRATQRGGRNGAQQLVAKRRMEVEWAWTDARSAPVWEQERNSIAQQLWRGHPSHGKGHHALDDDLLLVLQPRVAHQRADQVVRGRSPMRRDLGANVLAQAQDVVDLHPHVAAGEVGVGDGPALQPLHLRGVLASRRDEPLVREDLSHGPRGPSPASSRPTGHSSPARAPAACHAGPRWIHASTPDSPRRRCRDGHRPRRPQSPWARVGSGAGASFTSRGSTASRRASSTTRPESSLISRSATG